MKYCTPRGRSECFSHVPYESESRPWAGFDIVSHSYRALLMTATQLWVLVDNSGDNISSHIQLVLGPEPCNTAGSLEQHSHWSHPTLVEGGAHEKDSESGLGGGTVPSLRDGWHCDTEVIFSATEPLMS